MDNSYSVDSVFVCDRSPPFLPQGKLESKIKLHVIYHDQCLERGILHREGNRKVNLQRRNWVIALGIIRALYK